MNATRIPLDLVSKLLDGYFRGVVIMDEYRHIIYSNGEANRLLTDLGFNQQGAGISRHLEDCQPLKQIALQELSDRGQVTVNGKTIEYKIHSEQDGHIHYYLISLPVSRSNGKYGLDDRTINSLTKSELRICKKLAMGLNLASISSLLNISIHTARTHLRSIFRKTGCCRQAELVKKLLEYNIGALEQN